MDKEKMTLAFAYSRISEEDQSYHSLEAQRKLIEMYCQKRKYKIQEWFEDDGYTARNFNRPGWKALLSQINKYRKTRKCVILVMKYDRLVRNTLEGLIAIQKIEEQWKCEIESVSEPIMVHRDHPMYFQTRVSLLTSADIESRNTSFRVRTGNWQAKSKGRHINRAPYGYINERDEKDLPIITPDYEKTPIISSIIEGFLLGLPDATIRANAKEQGFTLSGKDAIKRIVRNPIYYGLIEVPPFMDEPKRYVKGIHEGIKDEKLFWVVMERLEKRSKQPKVSFRPEIPLRGLLICGQCQKNLTGAKSRGRHGGHYWYYRCNPDGQNHNAKKAHAQMDQIIETLSFPKQFVERLQIELQKAIENKENSWGARLNYLEEKSRGISKKIDDLEEKYIEKGTITDATYDKWHRKYQLELATIQKEIEDAGDGNIGVEQRFQSLLPNLTNLKWLFQKWNPQEKQAFLRLVSPIWIKRKWGYETPFINNFFIHNELLINQLDVLKVTDCKVDLGKFPISTPNDPILKPLTHLLESVA